MKQTKMFFLLFFEIELDVFITYIFRWLNNLNNYTSIKPKGLKQLVTGELFTLTGYFNLKCGK